MANNDNKCSDLDVQDNEYREFDFIFNMQKELQEKNYGYSFRDMSMGQLVAFLFMNKHALEDEMSETMDAVGGIHDGIGNAAWKPWKKDNEKVYHMSIHDLSERDRKELLMEIVDQFHFFMNQAVACGFTGSDIANAYIAKNKENWERQKRGY